jgi:O-antigen ligase
LLETTLAVLFVIAFVVRASLLPLVAGERLTSFLFAAPAAVLLLSVIYMAIDGVGRLHLLGVLLLAATGASLWHCERLDFAVTRWIGWSILVLILGPVRSTWRVRHFRRLSFTILSHVFLVATLLSAGWWLCGLPNLGRGDFTGVFAHSMTLGPVAGLAGLLALLRALDRGTPLNYALFGLSMMIGMLASSRSALAALAAGTLIVVALRWKRSPVISFAAVATAASFIVAPATAIAIVGSVLPSDFTEGLERKSFEHTREALWQARWDEFTSSPLTGVGFVSAWEDSAGFDDESGAVETGSSYLAMLSMTGCIGAGAGLLLAASLAFRTFSVWSMLAERQRLHICGFAGFWLVHLGAEGYIYGVSSMMGLTFWLWIGRLHDELQDVAHRKRQLQLWANTRSHVRHFPSLPRVSRAA